jgi:hypothetical protein
MLASLKCTAKSMMSTKPKTNKQTKKIQKWVETQINEYDDIE